MFSPLVGIAAYPLHTTEEGNLTDVLDDETAASNEVTNSEVIHSFALSSNILRLAS